MFAQFDACIQDLVRCVALTRLVYGEGHLKLAQAHVRLAKAYFQFKGNFGKRHYCDYTLTTDYIITNGHLKQIHTLY